MNISELIDRLDTVKARGDAAWTARCPAHDDRQASLSVGVGKEGRILLRCFAGCTTDAITSALGLTLADLFPDEAPAAGRIRSAPKEIAATYAYVDEAGALLYEVVRYRPKDFRQRRPDGKGGWAWNLQGVRRVLYRLPDVRAAAEVGGRVYVVEGEKDADNLTKLGLCATTNAGGADKWDAEFSESLRGAHVVLIPDNDAPGRKHVARAAADVLGAAASVRVLELPDLPEKGDVTDWLRAARERHGGDLADVRADLDALADAAPEWHPENAAGMEPIEHAGPCPAPEFSAPPRSLSAELLPVPRLDPRLLPASFRGWLTDIATRASLPLEYPAAAALVALSAVVGRRVGIRPKRFDSWAVVPNCWGAIVGQPGVMKTPAAQEALMPLRRLEAAARDTYQAAKESHEADTLVRKAQAEAARDELKKAARKSGTDRETLRALAVAAQDTAAGDAPTWTRYQVNDCTVEKLGEILRENPNGVLLFRDELVGFFKTLERQGHEADRAFYLEAWNGAGSFTYDRIGRGTVVIEAACLSVFGTIQPGPLARYLRGAATGEEADGFASRLQVLVYPDPPPAFRNVDRYPDAEAKNAAYLAFERLAHVSPEHVGAQVEEGESAAPLPFLRFSDEAQCLFDGWREALENRLRGGADTPLMQMHMAKFRSLMPSIALLLHLAENPDGGPVPGDAAARAIRWCEFLEAHARRLYQVALDGDMDAGQRLAERIRQSLPNPFTVRQVVRKGWSGLATTEEVERAVGFLEERGWVQSVETPAGPQGGRPSPHVYINPMLLTARDDADATREKSCEPDTSYRQNRQNLDSAGFVGFVSTPGVGCEIFTDDLTDPFDGTDSGPEGSN